MEDERNQRNLRTVPLFRKMYPAKMRLKKYADNKDPVSNYKSIWYSVMHGDFGRYIIGTNSESIPWSNRPLGDYISPAPEERWEDFLLTLSIEARQALKAWEESKITDVMKFNSSKLQSDNTGEPNEITPQEQYMEVLLLRLLTEEQRSTLKSTNTLTQDCADSSFDLRIAQSWIFLRCIQLGLTKDRFWKSDRDHYSTLSYNDKCKIERIGKKYQWIAYYEFLGLLADNYALKPPWNSSKSPEYLGPWLDLLRDIDPTCLTDGLSDEELPPSAASPDTIQMHSLLIMRSGSSHLRI